MEIEKIKIIKIKNKNYPFSLKKIPNPPKVLYFKGKLLKKEKCFAIVGTRKCSNYGKEIAFSIAQDLVRGGLTIVSGLARGIDTFAHQGALQAKGRTIAILGSGVDEKSIYPKENIGLARKIIDQGGALISEYPPGTPARKENFPQRNRIISGISLGVLVVEGKTKSGALITATLAKTQKKKVFAIPGSIYSQNSKGCHLLIKNGANLAESGKDILKKLNLPFFEKEKLKGNSPEENLILKILKENGGLTIDKIIEKTKLPPNKVSAILSLMEIEGKIKNLEGNTYILTY